MRAAFGMSGTPNGFEFLKSLPFEMSRPLRRRFNAPDGFHKIRPQDEGTGNLNCGAIFDLAALTRLVIFSEVPFASDKSVPAGEPVAAPSTKTSAARMWRHRLARGAFKFSGKLMLAAKPQVLLRFQPRHPEQVA
jgi:hypothetical protein